MDDASVHNCASRDLQAVFLEILIHPMKQWVAQIVLLHQMAEFAQSGLIENRFCTEVNAYKSAQCAGVVQGLFCDWVRQVKPMLEKMDPQYAFNAYRATSRSLWMGIKGLDYFGQFFPEDKSFHHLSGISLYGSSCEISRIRFRKGFVACHCSSDNDVRYYKQLWQLIRVALSL